jgi:uncharacterized protein (TIGR03083 family)
VPAAGEDAALVDRLEDVWSSLARLGDSLTEPQWKMPTECPGWSVQDNLAHVVGIESVLLGRDDPSVRGDLGGDHIKNEVGRSNEVWVDAFRDQTGAAVLAEFRTVTAARLAALRDPGLDFGAESWTPIGAGTVRDLLPFRIFDSWIHEQDMRRAVGKPGGWDGGGALVALDRIASVMPMVVGKKVKPPDGATIVFEVTGPAGREIVIGMEGGRAQVLDAVLVPPTIRLRLDGDTFVRLATGRGDAEEILDSGSVELLGKPELGRTIARSMNFLF